MENKKVNKKSNKKEVSKKVVAKKVEVKNDVKKEEKIQVSESKPETKSKFNYSTIIIIVAVIAFICCSFFINVASDPKKELSMDDWLNSTKSEKYTVTVIASSTCPHCQEYKPIITALAEKYDISLYFFEGDTLSKEDYNKLTTTYEFNNYEGYVPYTFIMSNGQMIADTTGFESEESTIEFLKKYNVIK